MLSRSGISFGREPNDQSESMAQYAAALWGLVLTCEFGALSKDMIRDQTVAKTSNARIRQSLLLEDTLMLDKALKISAQIENAAAEAKR